MQKVKGVIWDLDGTLWDGVLLERDRLEPRPGVKKVIETLDSRGILQSIASKNDFDPAMAQLERLGLKDYFLYPQINWNAKSHSIRTIAERINIGTDTLAFVDDQPFERHEVAFSLPEVRCIDAADAAGIPDLPEMIPDFITDDSRRRRLMYLADIERNRAEASFEGPMESFLKTLGMVLRISRAEQTDLQRAEELTVRTHQLNTTGYTYSFDELDHFRTSPDHMLLMASLSDQYGAYGKIGLALIECGREAWVIKLLLMSCRVISRGVGAIVIHHIRRLARAHKVRLLAEMIPNERNRMMYITYKFAGFSETGRKDGRVIFENDLETIPEFPDYAKVIVD